MSTGSKANPIANPSCNWDNVLIFNVLEHFLGLFDGLFQCMSLFSPIVSSDCMSAFHLLHKGMSFLMILSPEQIYCTSLQDL